MLGIGTLILTFSTLILYSICFGLKTTSFFSKFGSSFFDQTVFFYMSFFEVCFLTLAWRTVSQVRHTQHLEAEKKICIQDGVKSSAR